MQKEVQSQHGLLKILSHIFPKWEHKKKYSTFYKINLLDFDIVLCMGNVYSHFSSEKLRFRHGHKGSQDPLGCPIVLVYPT